MSRENISKEDLKAILSVSEHALDAYLKGARNVPLANAILLADKYNFSLDWFYKRSDFLDTRDTMVEIVLALNKVFKFKVRSPVHREDRTIYWDTTPTLLVEEEFFEYLQETQELQRIKFTGEKFITDVEYNRLRKELAEKYQTRIREVFGRSDFCEYKDIEFESIELFKDK